jgi:hypothetical protein
VFLVLDGGELFEPVSNVIPHFLAFHSMHMAKLCPASCFAHSDR